MKRLIKIVFLIYLGTRLEHFSGKLLVKYGLAEVDQYGNFRKSKDWDKRVDEIVGRAIPKKLGGDGTY